MKITRKQLKRIIKEEYQHSLHELDGPNLPNAGAASTEGDEELAIAAAEIMLGFTPAGLAIDFKDLAKAIEERDPVFAAMAGIGFIPGIGDFFKAPYKFSIASAKQAKMLDKLAKELGDDGLEQLGKRGTVGALRGARKTLQQGLEKPGTYFIHRIFGPGAGHATDSFIKHGVAKAGNRGTVGRLKVSAADRLDSILNPVNFISKQPIRNETRRAVIIRVPDGMEGTEAFNWVKEVPGFGARAGTNLERFTERFSPDFIVGVWDPVAETFIKGAGF